MFNLKDVPVATGYSFVTLGLVALFAREKGVLWRSSVAGSSLALGLLIGLGTRPGVAPFFVTSIVVAMVALMVIYLVGRSRRMVLYGVAIAVFLIGALVFVSRFTAVGQEIFAGVVRSADFPWSGTNLYAGELVGSRPGVGVILRIFLSQAPLGFTALVVLGIVTMSVLFLRSRHEKKFDFQQRVMFVLVVVQAVGAFLVLWLIDPVIYDGGRQILFVFPAFALIGTAGVIGTLEFIRLVLPYKKVAPYAVVTLFGLFLVVNHVEQLRLFPYNYIYYNAVGQGTGVNGRWETDYWAASTKEGAAHFVIGDAALCGGAGNLNRNIGPDLRACGVLSPYISGDVQTPGSELDSNQFWVVRTQRSLTSFGPVFTGNCTLHSEVTRPLRFETVVLSRVYRCDDL